jgi:polysaccharide export outer membrane protein
MQYRVLCPLVVAFAALLSALTGCGGSRPPPPRNFPVPAQNTEVAAGDVFEVSVVGDPGLSKEYEIYPDGTVDFPHVGHVQVEKLEPQKIAQLIHDKLIEAKYLMDPQVSVKVKTYKSKQIRVIGAVIKPGSLSWSPKLRLVDALSQAGWFTPLADTNAVVITRQVEGRTVRAVVSVDAITKEGQEDILLQAGDTILVEQRVF